VTSHPPDWELLQTFLGLAFTIQQEAPNRERSAPAAYGQHPALERIATFAQNLTEASGAAIALGDTGGMVCVARSGVSAPPVGAEFNASDGLSGECIRSTQPVVCVNAAADPRVNYQACRSLNIASLLYLPLYSAQGTLMGILGVFSPQPLHFSQRDISCLRRTERLVQEALGATAENPDPATPATLLRQAGVEAPCTPEQLQQNELATEIEVPLSSLPKMEAPRQTSAPLSDGPAAKSDDLQKPRSDSIFVGRVVDDSVVDEPVTRDDKNEEESEGRSRIPVMLIVILLLLVISAGYKYRRSVIRPEEPAPVAVAKATGPASPIQDIAAATQGPSIQRLTEAVSMAPTENGVVVQIELPKAVRYEGYQLEHPDRIYFDLHDVKLSDDKGSEFKQADGLISGVRLFTYANGVTRIVLDLRHPASFAARLEEKPARLTIEVKRVGDASKISQVDPQTKSDLQPNSP